MNAKVILIGTGVSVGLIIGSQLAFVLLASYVAMSDVVWLKANKESVWVIIGTAVYALSLLFGGVITATLAEHRRVLHAAIAGSCAALLSVLTAGDLSALCEKAILVVLLGIGAAALGGKLTR